MKADMQTLLVSDLDPTLDDAAVLGARITIYTSFMDAERVWREAVAGCACYVFQTFEWNSVWKNTIGSTQQVAERIVHVAAADGRTLMLLPLGIYQSRYFTSLQFLGGDATDYNAPVIDRAFAGEVSANGFAKLWRIIIGLMPRVRRRFFDEDAENDRGSSEPHAASARGPPQRNCVRGDAAGEFCRFHDRAQHRLLSPEPL